MHHGFEDGQAGKIDVAINEDSNKTLIVNISDNGQGMSNEVLENVFEPFYTTKRINGNVGLGLHIVYTAITQSLRGEIHISSNVGKGTNITLKIPNL